MQEPIERAHLDGTLPNDLAQLGNVIILLDGCPQIPVIIRLDCCWFTPKSSVGAGGAAPQVSDLAQVLWQVVLMLSLGSQFQVPAERIQPHRVGPTGGKWGGVRREGLSGKMTYQPQPSALSMSLANWSAFPRTWWLETVCPLPMALVGASSPPGCQWNQNRTCQSGSALVGSLTLYPLTKVKALLELGAHQVGSPAQ